MYRKYIPAMAGAAALAICSAGGALAQTVPGVPYNTDLKITPLSSLTIIDQQSPYTDDNGNPIYDSNGNEETIDITSVDLDLLLTYSSFPAALRKAIANGGVLSIAVRRPGFCAGSPATGPAGNETNDVPTEPFLIPLTQLRNGPSAALLVSTYLFEGLTEEEFAYYVAPVPDATAAPAAKQAPEPVSGPIPPADSQEGYEGVPFANLTLTLTPLNTGELKLDGITDVSEILGVPQGKVDLVVTLGAQGLGIPASNATGVAAPAEAACLPNVTPTVVIVPANDGLGGALSF
jgi:hypothetical protein